MKNKEIEKMLRSDIEKSAPDVWDRIAPRAGIAQAETAGGGRLKLFTAVTVPLVLLLAAAILLLVFLLPKGTVTVPIRFGSGGFVFLDINPSVQFELDGNGKVRKAVALNDDARVLIAGKESELRGLDAAAASERILAMAVETGYISPDRKTNAVLVSAELRDEESARRLSGDIKTALKSEFKEMGVYGVVITDRRDVSVKEEADAYGITESKMRLIKQAEAMGVAFSEEEKRTISVSDVYARMAARAEELEDSLSPELEAEYERLTEQAEDMIEPVIERIEDLLENIEELADDNDDVEAAAEELEDALETLEDAVERSLPVEEIFAAMYEKLDALGGAVGGQLQSEIKTLTAEIKKELDDFKALNEKLAEKKREILTKQAEREAKYGNTLDGHVKPKGFDEDYERWAAAAEKEYEERWEALKEAWEKEND